MTSRLSLICLLIPIIFFACKKSVCGCVTPQPTGIYGQKDGVAWVASSITDTSQYDGVTLYAKTDSDMLKIKFLRTTYIINVYYVPQNYEATYYVTRGVHGKLTYMLDTTAANTIKVAFGTGVKAGNVPNIWIYSNFNLTFKLSTPTGNAAFDNKRVNFSNGTIQYGLQN